MMQVSCPIGAPSSEAAFWKARDARQGLDGDVSTFGFGHLINEWRHAV